MGPAVFLAYCFLSHTIRQIFLYAIYIASSVVDTGINSFPFSSQQSLLDMKTITIPPFSSLDKTTPTHASESGDLSHGFLLIFLAKLLQLLIKSMVLKLNEVLLLRSYQIKKDCFVCLIDKASSRCHICLIHNTADS